MRAKLLHTLLLGVAFGIMGCGSNDNSTAPIVSAGGGSAAATGGNNATATGGASATGSTSATTGGVKATGGNSSSGGNTGASSGGVYAAGGTGLTSGGITSVATSGSKASGGNSASSGGITSVATGGSKASGGSSASSGGITSAATGGTKATGGSSSGSGGITSVATGGTNASGGNSSSNGGTNTGGAAGGDTSTAAACPPATPRTGGKQYCSPPANGTADGNYTYDLWSDGTGSGCLTVYGVDAAFKANWTNVGDWIARVGLSFDKTKTYDQIGTFSSDFAYTMTGITTGGFGNIGIYGWSVSPLHEYYIAENWLGKKPNFTLVGTFTIDGEGTYDVMTNQQKNAANITGTNQDFVQFWSVRQTPRQCGHISISKHFAEWASLGLQLGKLEETRILVEAQNNTGTIDFTTATVLTK